MIKTILIAILSTASVVLLYLLFSLPTRPTDLILNEKSYLQVLNETDYQTILAKRISINSSRGQSPGTLKAKESANQVTELMISTYSLFNETIASSANPDSLRKKSHLISNAINRISTIGFASKFLNVEFINKLEDPDLYNQSKKLLGLPLLLLESDLLFGINGMMDSLAMWTDAMNVKFDQLSNIKLSKGPSWVKGQIVFNPPVSMNLYQKERIQVRISKKYSDELAKSIEGNKPVVSDSLAVGDIMMVKLLGEDFDIVAYDDEEQGVTIDGYTQWEFDVTAKTSGHHNLYIKAGIVYYVPNLGPAKKYFPAYEKAIDVEVSAWQAIAGFATTRWEFLVSSILIPLAVWGFSKLRSRRKSAGNTHRG